MMKQGASEVSLPGHRNARFQRGRCWSILGPEKSTGAGRIIVFAY